MRIALGTVQFGMPYGITNTGGQVTGYELKSMLVLAEDYGIDTLDTAINYGESEKCLGELDIKYFKMVTKLPAVPDDCGDINSWVHAQISASLMRLGVNSVYGLLLHYPEQLLGSHGKELYQTLQSLKEYGLVQKVGVSIYSPDELEILTSLYHFDLIQAPFNLVDRRLYATGWLRRLKDEGIEIHVRSVFLQGLLLLTNRTMPVKFSKWSYVWKKWNKWILDYHVSAIHACLAFPLSFPEIDRIIVGADNKNQLIQIIDAATNNLQVDFPDLQCEDENLINPSCWPHL